MVITLQFCGFNLSMTKTSSGEQFVVIKIMLWPGAKGTHTNRECDFYLFSLKYAEPGTASIFSNLFFK